MPVRLVLVDDHEMVIEGLKAMLAAFSDRVEVVGQAVGADRAVDVVDDLQPDVVLCDVRMQGSSGLDLCKELRERDPGRRVVMLSVYDDEQYLYQALRCLKRRLARAVFHHLHTDHDTRTTPCQPAAA